MFTQPPYGLRTEKISAAAFTAEPRSANLYAYLYRVRPSYGQGTYEPYKHEYEWANPPEPNSFSPNSYIWPTFTLEKGDWTVQHLLGSSGKPLNKTGTSIWLFHPDKDMPLQTAFSSVDGDALIVPQSGALNIQTESGKFLVRQNEIPVIPRGVRYRVVLVRGKPVQGFISELNPKLKSNIKPKLNSKLNLTKEIA
ncbi:homogentisate 1,2-dioxygenase [Fusarium austroafricanum]|uniref:homogentisate 1,2-dioxygenase n=1 Tax=Fusarium austroafricanum TaxID=2364996 RepID=A0A8H4JJS9_9HYPO|nr:homogentisate 1,2-dioxygenase [Fusarium austroafricanum]